MPIEQALTDARRIHRRFLTNWTRFLPTHVAVNLLAFTILGPLAGLLLRLAVSLSGEAALSDEDILFFALTPVGFTALLVIGSLFSILVFLEHAALLVVSRAVLAGRVSTSGEILLFLAGRMAALFRLAMLVLVRVLLNLLPFVLALLAIFYLLLTEYDINYYLAERPPEWRLAIALGAIVGGLCALNLLRLFINWVFCLPLQLFSRRKPSQALADSREAVRGQRARIGLWLLAWLVVSFLFTAAVSAMVSWTGAYLIPHTAASLKTLVPALGLLALFAYTLYFAISLAASSWLSLLIMTLFRERPMGTEEAASRPEEAAAPQRLAFTPRAVGVGLLFGFAAAAIMVFVIISRLHIVTSTEVMAHRGASAAAPENTLAAIELAIENGAHWVEIDVQESRDGHVVVIHDRDLKKIGGSPLTVAGSSLEQLQQVDVGSWFGPEFADQRIPTLDQVLALCKDRIGVNIELKYYGQQVRLEERVVEAVERAGMSDQVVIMSLSMAGVQKLNRLRPDWKVGLLSSVAVGNLANLDVDFLALNGRAASRALIRQAHRNGKEVMVWTVNDAITMGAMIGRGADALITDKPDLAVEVIEQFGQLEPAERLLIQLADAFDRPGLYSEQ